MELGATADGAADRIVLDGPELTLPRHAVRTVSLALHELATNAVKHGALRGEGRGRISITWGIHDGARLFLEWVETGAVRSAPHSGIARGFGRELIEQALPYELDAQTRLDIREDGVHCSIEFPLDEGGP